MAVTDFVPVDPTLIETIQRHMKGLQSNPGGADLHALIEKGLKKFGAGQGHITQACVTYLHSTLLAYADDTSNNPSSRIKARIIQQHLVLYLPQGPTTPPPNPFQPYIDTINSIGRKNAPRPPLSAVSYSRVNDMSEEDDTSTTPNNPAAVQEAGQDRDNQQALDVEGKATDDATSAMRELEETLDSGEPPEGVGEKRYQALRKSELDAWRAIYGTIKDFKNLKRLWVSSLDDLLQQREALAEKLDNAKQHMLSLESDREKLRKELELAHKNAALAVARLPAPAKPVAKPARKLSSLPKRDAFLRQLEAEIERAKRAGQNASLSLALIDVDNLDSLVEKHSRKTGDAVLQCYVNNILSNFRTYDVIARYDNNQFAVLFPDTAEGGALRALEKAQKRASETHMNHDGKSMPLPSFSSALTVYSSGDDPSTLLSRAMVALEDARMKGRTLAIADTSLGQFH